MHYVLLARVPEDGEDARRLLERVESAAYPIALAVRHPFELEEIPSLDSGRVEWIRTGYSEPWFPLLPEGEITRQIEREATEYANMGATPGPLWLTGPWATHLPGSFRRAGVEALLLGAHTLDTPAPGVVAHLDAVLPVIPVHPRTILSSGPPAFADAAAAVEVEFDDIDDVAKAIQGRPGSDLTTVTEYLASHRPQGRRRPRLDDWEARYAEDPDRFVLHRKLVRLVTRVPDRLGSKAERAVLEAERARGFADDEVDAAHLAIIEARTAIDGERRRGDDWWKVSRLDWDVDGGEEVHVELRHMSMVVAPHRSGAIPTLDMKQPAWPASAISGEPGWTLCRFSSDLEGLEARPIELEEARTTEVRGGTVELELTGVVDDGSFSVNTRVHGTVIDIEYRLDAMPAGRIGPELKLNLGSDAQVRVDGSEWFGVTGPTPIAGHKIRITDGTHQAVLTTLTPCSAFLRPGVDGTGLVLWPHWATSGSAIHQLTIDLTPLPSG